MTRTGKIARLPCALRDQLNQRLHDGDQGKGLIAWLNALPEVQTILAAKFHGRAINHQNLTEWKQGGYRDWVAQQAALHLAKRIGSDVAQVQADGPAPFTEALAIWLAARYFMAVRHASQDQQDWPLLRDLCADVVELRQGDVRAQRLRLDRAKLALQIRRMHEKPPDEKTPLPPKAISGVVPAAAQPAPVPQGLSTTAVTQPLPSIQTKSNQIKPDKRPVL